MNLSSADKQKFNDIFNKIFNGKDFDVSKVNSQDALDILNVMAKEFIVSIFKENSLKEIK